MRLSRESRKQQILDILFFEQVHPFWSHSRIARKMGMSPSSHLLSLLYELVDSGDVMLITQEHHGISGKKCYFGLRAYIPVKLQKRLDNQ